MPSSERGRRPFGASCESLPSKNGRRRRRAKKKEKNFFRRRRSFTSKKKRFAGAGVHLTREKNRNKLLVEVFFPRDQFLLGTLLSIFSSKKTFRGQLFSMTKMSFGKRSLKLFVSGNFLGVSFFFCHGTFFCGTPSLFLLGKNLCFGDFFPG